MPDPIKWETKKIIVKSPQAFQDLFKTWKAFSSPLRKFFDTVRPVLKAARTFLSAERNPILAAMTFTLDEILKFISQLKNSGIHLIVIGPSEQTNNRTLSKLPASKKPPGEISWANLFPGLSSDETRAFYLLNTDTILDAYVDSFADSQDLDRPPSDGAKRKLEIIINPADLIEGSFFKINTARNLKIYYIWFGREGVVDSTGLAQKPLILTNPTGDTTWRDPVTGELKKLPLTELVQVDSSTNIGETLRLEELGKRTATALSNIVEFDLISNGLVDQTLDDGTVIVDEQNNPIQDYKIVIENVKEGRVNDNVDGGSVTIPSDQTLNGLYPSSFEPENNTNFDFINLVAGQDSVADDFFAGGAILFFGVLGKGIFGGKNVGIEIKEALSSLLTIIALLDFLISFDGLTILRNDIEKTIKDTEYILSAEPDKTAFPSGSIDGPPPNWDTVKLFRDVIPIMGEVLNDIERQVEGIKNSIDTGGSKLIDNLIDFLDGQIGIIDAIITNIDKIDAFFEAFSVFAEAEMNLLLVEPQDGGINKLKVAAGDRFLEGRPSSDLQYCFLMSFVGAGTGFSLLLNMLGLSDTVDLGTADNVPFKEDNFRSFYNI